MKKIFVGMVIVLSSSSFADSPKLYGSDGKFLGNVNNNPYDPNSISNPYGRYGNPYSADSVNNPYGKYGSPYSPDSVRNRYNHGNSGSNE